MFKFVKITWIQEVLSQEGRVNCRAQKSPSKTFFTASDMQMWSSNLNTWKRLEIVSFKKEMGTLQLHLATHPSICYEYVVREIALSPPSATWSVRQYFQVPSEFKEANTQTSHGFTSVVLKLINLQFE